MEKRKTIETMLRLSTIGIGIISFVAAFAISSTRQKWRDQTDFDFANLIQEIAFNHSLHPMTTATTVAMFENGALPLPVVRHLNKVLRLDDNSNTSSSTNNEASINMRIKSLRVDQIGTFLLNEKWINFTATQLFSTSNTHPGFVWEADMQLPLFFSGNSGHLGSVRINVRDSYVKGKGTMVGKLLEFLPIVNVHDTQELNEGQMSRWLGESVLFPTSLIPQTNNNGEEENDRNRCKLTWKETSNRNSAIAILKDKVTGVKTEIEFRFDEQQDGLIHSIYAMRPYMEPGSSDRVKMLQVPWEGHFFDYEDQDGILVPTRMEVGWWKNDDFLELYFKGHNTKFVYDYY